MRFVSPSERAFLISVSQLAYCNPFLPEWVESERSALGCDFVEGEPVRSFSVIEPRQPRANIWRIVDRLEKLSAELRARLQRSAPATELELVLYEDGVVYLLYQRFYKRFYDANFAPTAG